MCIEIITLTTRGMIDCKGKMDEERSARRVLYFRSKMMMASIIVVAVELVESSCIPDVNIRTI